MKTVRIAAVADLHGMVCDPVDCDLLIVAGDSCPEAGPLTQHVWLDHTFRDYLLKHPRALWVAGNHDYCCEGTGMFIPDFGTDHVYLRDSGHRPFENSPELSIPNLLVWGTPWSLPFGHYAFMAGEREMVKHLARVAERPDILVSHGPPFGLGDEFSPGRHVGSVALLDFIRRHRPTLTIVGHCHDGRGVYTDPESGAVVVNASCSEKYRPIIVTIEDRDGRPVITGCEE